MNKTEIINIDMPFWGMVKFMIKWAVASIPAMLVLTVMGIMFVLFSTLVLGVLAG